MTTNPNTNPNTNPDPQLTYMITAELRHGTTIAQLQRALAGAAIAIDPDRGTVRFTNHQADRPGGISTTTVTFSGPPPQDEQDPPIREHRGGRVIRDIPASLTEEEQQT